MRSGIDFSCGRIRHANRPRSTRQFLRQSFRPPQPPGERTWLIGSSNKRRPALPHSRAQLPCFDNLPNSSALRAKIAPLFSHTYKLLFPQTPSFDILTNCRGCHPLDAAKRANFAAAQGSISFVSYSCALFHTSQKTALFFSHTYEHFCTPKKFNLLIFIVLRTLSQKHPGGGVPSRTSCV